MTHHNTLLLNIGKGKKQTPVLSIVFMALYSLMSNATVQAGVHNSIPGPFRTVTEANHQCITCHEAQASDLRRSTHWSGNREKISGEQANFSRKATDLSRFGLEAAANPEACRRCHMNLSPQRQSIQTAASDINCLICHDTTETYKPEIEGIELEAIIRTVGKPSAQNCRSCHERQCGLTPDSRKTIPSDIHIQRHGFTCQSCHPGN